MNRGIAAHPRACLAIALGALSVTPGCDVEHGPLRFDGRPVAAWVAELADPGRDPLPALEAVGQLAAESGLADLEETDTESADLIRGRATSKDSARISGKATAVDRSDLQTIRPRLVMLARDPRDEVRRRALCNLAAIGTVPGPEEEVLRAAIEEATVPIRACALLATARFQGASATLAEAAALAAGDASFRIRSSALMALGSVSGGDDRYLDVFATALDDPSVVIRKVAADTIAEDLRRSAGPLATKLRERLATAEHEFEADAMRRAIDAVAPEAAP